MDTATWLEELYKATRRKCGHGSSYTCPTCEARITAEVYLEGISVLDLIPVLAAALRALGDGGADKWADGIERQGDKVLAQADKLRKTYA